MVHVGISDQEMTTFIKETFCVDSTYTAKQLFDAAELPPSWESVRTMLKLSAARGNELQNALRRLTYLPTLHATPPRDAWTYLPTPCA